MHKTKIAALLSIGVIAATTLPALAASVVNFTPNGNSNCGTIKCDVNVSALGTVPIKGGSASINGRVITIRAASEYVESPQTVLIGSVLRSESNLTSSPQTLTGLALFLLGDWVEQIDDPTNPDVIFRSTGQVQGRIIGIENDAIAVRRADGQQEKIPINSILYLRSPRVFVFKLDLRSKKPLEKDTVFQAEVVDSSFRPTAAARTMSGSVIPEHQNSQQNNNSALGGLSGAKTASPSNLFDEDEGPSMQPSFTPPSKKAAPKMMLPPGLSFE